MKRRDSKNTAKNEQPGRQNRRKQGSARLPKEDSVGGVAESAIRCVSERETPDSARDRPLLNGNVLLKNGRAHRKLPKAKAVDSIKEVAPAQNQTVPKLEQAPGKMAGKGTRSRLGLLSRHVFSPTTAPLHFVARPGKSSHASEHDSPNAGPNAEPNIRHNGSGLRTQGRASNPKDLLDLLRDELTAILSLLGDDEPCAGDKDPTRPHR